MVSTSTRLCFAPEGSLVSVRTFTLQPSLEDSLALLAGFGNSEIVTPRNRQLLIRFLKRTACALDQEFMMRQRQHQPFTRGDAARWERIASSFATVDSLAVFVNEALEEMSCLERFTFTEVQLTKLRRADLLPGKHTWATFSPCACADCGGRRVVRWCTDCEACFRCEGKSGGLLCVRAAVDPLSPPTPSPQLAGCSGARGGGGGGGGNVGEEEEEEEEEVGGDWWKTWQQQPSQMKASKSSSGHQMAPNRLAEDTSRILKAGHYSCSSSSSSSNIVRLELPRLGASYRACRTVMATAASEGGNGKKQNKAAPKGAPKGASKGEVACSTHSSAAVVMEVVEEDSFDAALTTMTRESSSLSSSSSSFPPCVLDFASDSKPGGGWRTKQQGTQEESLCRRSSLGCCLEEHHRRVGHAKYMPINAVIYCPEVVVFRGSRNGALLAKPAWVAVAAAALREVKQEQEIGQKVEGVLRTIATAAAAAASSSSSSSSSPGHRTVVLGAWGCGAFGNSTEAVARQMVAAVQRVGRECQLERVVFAVPDKQKAAIFRTAILRL